MNENRSNPVERLRQELLHPTEIPTLHHTQLPPAGLESPLCQEWNTYRREVARLLAEGNEGRWVLIADQEIIGLWDTEEAANRARVERFPTKSVLVKQVLSREPIVRCTRLYHPGFLNPCRS
jgi:hypothetical protein